MGLARDWRTWACGLVVAAAALWASASPAPVHAAAPPRVNLERELRGLVRLPGGPPGAIAVVQRGGKRTVYSAGIRDLSSREAVRPLDFMRLASTAKAFSGAVALSLVDQHRLSLNDTIAKWLPQLPAAWGKVTLAEALQHTSGLPDFTMNKSFVDYLLGHLHATPSPLFLLRFIAHEKLEFEPPGAQYRYSNTDNFVVALMAEAATHRSYNQLLASQVYKPLGLTHTSLPRGPRMPVPYMHGYELNRSGPPDDVSRIASAAYAWASGGLVSTPADLNSFIRGYAGAHLFSRAVQQRQLHFVAGSSEPIGPGTNAAGLAIFRYRTRCGTVYGHTGNTSGYTQFMAGTLDGKRSVTVSITAQITNKSKRPEQQTAFRRLRQIEGDTVCLALS
jgi:D-alanyl-D-alanine carboxypeptidase